MSIERVKEFFEEKGYMPEIYVLDQSTATVQEAADAHGVEPGRIAKTMAIRLKDRVVLLVMAGDGKVDNKKFKEYFSEKCSMVKMDAVEELTGHPVGGVCPFGNPVKLETYLDNGLKRFEYVFPAAGEPSASLKITPDRLQEVVDGVWVDITKDLGAEE